MNDINKYNIIKYILLGGQRSRSLWFMQSSNDYHVYLYLKGNEHSQKCIRSVTVGQLLCFRPQLWAFRKPQRWDIERFLRNFFTMSRNCGRIFLPKVLNRSFCLIFNVKLNYIIYFFPRYKTLWENMFLSLIAAYIMHT